jgi:sec-independent protein translocase protein TatA
MLSPMRLGFGEILIVLVVVLLIFGANKIPQLGDALGKGIRNFRKATGGGDDAIDVTPPKDPEQIGGAQRPAQQPEQQKAPAEPRKP